MAVMYMTRVTNDTSTAVHRNNNLVHVLQTTQRFASGHLPSHVLPPRTRAQRKKLGRLRENGASVIKEVSQNLVFCGNSTLHK